MENRVSGGYIPFLIPIIQGMCTKAKTRYYGDQAQGNSRGYPPSLSQHLASSPCHAILSPGLERASVCLRNSAIAICHPPWFPDHVWQFFLMFQQNSRRSKTKLSPETSWCFAGHAGRDCRHQCKGGISTTVLWTAGVLDETSLCPCLTSYDQKTLIPVSLKSKAWSHLNQTIPSEVRPFVTRIYSMYNDICNYLGLYVRPNFGVHPRSDQQFFASAW